MALTLSGLVLSVVILMVGMIISETYLESKQYYIKPYRESNGVIAQSNVDYKTYDYFKNQTEYNVSMEIDNRLVYKLMELGEDEYTTNIYGRGIRVDENMNLALVQMGEDTKERYCTKLVRGRLINIDDIYDLKKVTVIDTALAGLLFGTEEALGKEIKFPVNDEFGNVEYESFEIVGVIEASDYANKNVDTLKKMYMEEQGELLSRNGSIFQFNFYIPYSIKMGNSDNADNTMNIIFTSKTEAYRDIRYEIMMVGNRNSYIDINNVIDADVIYNMYAADIKSSQETILYAVLIIFVISGLSIMNTMMFSVKERINEIGIRKAVGAFNADIVGQFIFEGFVYGLISSVIGVAVAVVLSSHIFLLLNGSLFNFERLVVSKEAVMLSTAASILAGVLASIIPAVYSSHIKVADALRFD
ncbi:MAG: FtsX-like permease family protein [Lachnospiraceae bacterium]|nr:FtsX-like permease family protein [Lachnospiraceae bacterium]